jgi:glucose-6-phosphate isomerase
MALKKINPTTTASWHKLERHFSKIKDVHMLDWFDDDANRAKEFSIRWEDFYVDFSKNRCTHETLDLFMELLKELELQDAIDRYFDGDKINETEDRAVLHSALRASASSEIFVDGKNVIPEIEQVKLRLKVFTDAVINGTHLGHSGQPITDVVNIGIGGSDLGPLMVVEALKYYQNHLNVHFVSNVDGDHVNEIIKPLNPETTLFIIVSKSFSTQETLTNAQTIREWFLTTMDVDAIPQHFVAVSSNLEAVERFGIDKDNCFPMWDWVGGRFSLWSAVGLSISLAIGFDKFEKLLLGAQKMDRHFRSQPFGSNLPVILACLSIWYNNFFKTESEAVITYTQYLKYFTPYLQQASMESNGKGVDREGNKIKYQSGNVIWGEPGTNSQHAFFQLLHQGTKLIPTDFIAFKKSLYGNVDHHNKLISNFIAQTEALLKGKSDKDPFKDFEGNRPTNTIVIDKLTPESLGKLIALYEHKIFVQGIVWNIYSFDQFGVELGKKLANNVLSDLENTTNFDHDSSTKSLINHLKN